jgi:hypothetical protein
MFTTEDPGLVRLMATAAAERSPRVSTNILAACRMFKKDVKFNGTNSTSPLESTKVPKNKLKKGPIAAQKTSRKCVKEVKQSEKQTQRSNIPTRFSHQAGII